jgi:signal transduction histidine kinase/CheY-like chemotaxis protein
VHGRSFECHISFNFRHACENDLDDAATLDEFGPVTVDDTAPRGDATSAGGERFDSLVHDAPIGIYLVDSDFRLAEVNAAALPVFGDVGDPIGRDFEEVVRIIWPPSVAEAVLAIFRHTMATGEAHRTPELKAQRADRGVTEYYDWRVNRVALPGGRHGVVCYFTDVSQHVHAREALARSEGRYRTLFGSIDEGFCILQLIFNERQEPIDYRYIEINEVFEQQTGMTNALGRTIRELVPAIEQFWFDIYGTVALTGTPKRFVDHAESMGRWFDVYAFRIGEPHDRQVAVLFNDVTARRKMEEALQRAHEHEQQANRAKDDFIAMLGHELRNPLAPMLTALQLIRLRGAESRELAVIERQVAHLTRLVDDLLDVSRITRGKIELRRQPVDLRDVVLQAMELAGPLLEQRRNRLDVRMPAEGVTLDADRDRLAQVISNVMTNASKYSDLGSRLVLTGERDNAVVRVVVEDEGIGIPRDMLATVFDAFVQQPQSLDRTQGGLGLGLAIVKSLVTAHGGRVWCESEGVNRGCRFCIELPSMEAESRPPVPVGDGEPRALAPQSQPGRRVLIVDDNADAALMLQIALEQLGHSVEVAADGPSALARAQSSAPAVVLLDIGLPMMDGYEVARQLRARSGTPRPLLIAVTGYGQDGDRHSTHQAGFDHHLVKPVDLHDLEKLLKSS